MDRHVASLHRQQTDRFRQWRRALDEVQALPFAASLAQTRPSGLDPRSLLALQRTAGNHAVVAALQRSACWPACHGKACHTDEQTVAAIQPVPVSPFPYPLATPSVQRQPQARASRMQLQTDLLQWNGVTSLQLSDPTEPREGSKFWLLDFDAMVEDDSLLGRALAEQRRRRQIFTGQAPDDAPLTLQLLNAATNVLLNLPERSPLIERLHLERFNIVLDPTSGNYGVGATFRF